MGCSDQQHFSSSTQEHLNSESLMQSLTYDWNLLTSHWRIICRDLCTDFRREILDQEELHGLDEEDDTVEKHKSKWMLKKSLKGFVS
jgi:hypothetical protein